MRAAAVRVQRGDPRRRRRLRDREGAAEPDARVRASPASIPARSPSRSARSTAGCRCWRRASPPRSSAPTPRRWSTRSRAYAPFDLVLGPAGYGLPLVPAAEVGERELALMVLKRADEPEARAGIAGMRSIVRALIAAGIAARLRARRDPPPHRPGPSQVEPHRPGDRRQGRERGARDRRPGGAPRDPVRGDAVRAARARRRRSARRWPSTAGRSSTGSAARPARSARARAERSTRRRPISSAARSRSGPSSAAGRSTRTGTLDLGAPGALERLRADPRARDGWLALEEGAAKAVLALTASVPAPREVLVAGRLASAPGLLDALAERLASVAPVRPALAVKSAARGAALLADGLAGGSYAPLVDSPAPARGARRRARPPADVRRGADRARLAA